MLTKKDLALPEGYVEPVVPHSSTRARTYWINALLMVAVLGSVFGGIWQFQQMVGMYRDRYYGGLSTQVYNSTPLTFDSLAVDDNAWPMSTPANSALVIGKSAGASPMARTT
ncbi:MAG TPA: hypothetical protein VGP82_12835 [Ktedonobacterales bacterium]|jgi:hypothetical protein|nr:hypothetical protein [Ktedonobacterales bacterium]